MISWCDQHTSISMSRCLVSNSGHAKFVDCDPVYRIGSDQVKLTHLRVLFFTALLQRPYIHSCYEGRFDFEEKVAVCSAQA